MAAHDVKAFVAVFIVLAAVGTGLVLVDTTSTDIDDGEVAELVHDGINGERLAHGQTPLSYDTDLEAIARAHSEDMHDRDFFAHDTPDGQTVQDRYDAYGYECRIYITDTMYRDGGGENIAQTYVDERISTNGETTTHTSAEDVADGLVEQWMNSPGHRENLLDEHWQRQGVGIYVSDDGEVFATQNFC